MLFFMVLTLFFLLNLISSIVFTVYNPVYAAFFLILTFFCSAILIWIFNSSFFALIYIIIYVGAIAVLFLFVIMMLEIKILESSRLYDFNIFKQITVYLFFSIIPFLFSIIVSSQLQTDNFLEFDETLITTFDIIFDLQVMGQIIYNYYISCVLIGGFILLIAIIGAIILTLKLDNNTQMKLATRQLARSENFLSFFK